MTACSADRAAPAPLPVLALELEFVLDGHELEFSRIAWIRAAEDRTLFVAQPQEGMLRVFGPSGEPLGSIGSPGDGPGEFRGLTSAGFIGDTLWVLDRQIGRLNFLPPSLEVARTERWVGADGAVLDESPEPTRYIGLTPSAFYADGSFLALMESEAMLDLPIPPDFPVSHGLVGPDRSVRRLVAEHPFGRSRIQIVHEGGELHALSPFPLHAYLEAAPDGSSSALVEATVEGPDAGTLRITRFDPDGDTIYVVRHPFEEVSIPAGVADSALDARAQDAERFVPGMADAYRRAAWIPPVYPPLEGLVVGTDGSVWLRLRTTPDEGSRYHLLDPAGSPVGEASLPENVRLHVADGTHVWGLMSDALGVESVVRYRVRDPGGPGASP